MNAHQFHPMHHNQTVDTDAYKVTHPLAINPGLVKQYVYGEPRIGGNYPYVSYIGGTMIVQDHFLKPITNELIEEGREESYMTFGTDKYFNKEGWNKLKKLGYYPMKIMQAPEGGKYPISNVLFTMESHDDHPWFAPMLNGLETMKMHNWYPTTISTRAMYIKENLRPLVEKTGTPELLEFLVNDFGARGATSWESAIRGGVGFLVHFQGSDNMPASRAIGHYYNYKGRAKSVWATEHSCALSFGPGVGELEYVLHQLRNCPKDMICSIVIDAYDPIEHLKNVWGHPEVIALIKERTAPTVARPDSGEPKYSVDRCLDILASIYGYSFNEKGYKTLNHLVRVLQGDGMDEVSIIELYEHIIHNMWSADQLVVGSGGGMLQKNVTRDTSRWAIKPSFGIINGKEINFSKTVASDPTKGSKPGKLILHESTKGSFATFNSVTTPPQMFKSYHNVLKPLYDNGNFYPTDFKDVLERANYIK